MAYRGTFAHPEPNAKALAILVTVNSSRGQTLPARCRRLQSRTYWTFFSGATTLTRYVCSMGSLAPFGV